MKAFLLVAVFVFVSGPICFGQGKDLIVKVKVVKVPRDLYAKGVIPPESSSRIVIYKVLAVCSGKYAEEEIKVAYRGGGERKLKVDDELIIKIEPTTNYRDMAKFLRMDLGIVIPEVSIADFEFAGNIAVCHPY